MIDSLFRAAALMEHNVMKRYTTVAKEPRHFVQYDQGEVQGTIPLRILKLSLS